MVVAEARPGDWKAGNGCVGTTSVFTDSKAGGGPDTMHPDPWGQ